MRMFRTAMLTALLAAMGLLAACDNNDGPVEKAGEKVDEAVDQMDGQGTMEEMGEDLDNAYENAKESMEDMKDAAEN